MIQVPHFLRRSSSHCRGNASQGQRVAVSSSPAFSLHSFRLMGFLKFFFLDHGMMPLLRLPFFVFVSFLNRNLQAADKHHRPECHLVDISPPPDGTAPSLVTRPLLSESRPYSHFYIQESQDLGKQTSEDSGPGEQQRNPWTLSRRDEVDEDLQERPLHGRPAEQEYVSFIQFNIPNFVSLEPGSGQDEE